MQKPTGTCEYHGANVLFLQIAQSSKDTLLEHQIQTPIKSFNTYDFGETGGEEVTGFIGYLKFVCTHRKNCLKITI